MQSVLFHVEPSRGSSRRFLVPADSLEDELHDLVELEGECDLAFDDRSQSHVLWIMGQRLGLTHFGTVECDLSHCEVNGDCICGNIRLVIFGTME